MCRRFTLFTPLGYGSASALLRRFNVIEVEREHWSLSTLILSTPFERDWGMINNHLPASVVNAGGIWTIMVWVSISMYEDLCSLLGQTTFIFRR